MIARSGFTPPAPLPADRRLADRRLVKCSSACRSSHAAASHEAKCIASAQAFEHGMLATFIWEAAQQAACMLWEETEQVQDSGSVPEQLVELAATNSQVQSLSMDLYQNASVAANVEAWISELGDFAQGPSSLPLRDAIAWEVIARLDESRNIDQAVQQVCPDLCADQTRRSKLLNAVHKNLRQLMCMGEYVTTYAVPSAIWLGLPKSSGKEGRSAGRIRMHPKTLRRSWISLMVRLRRIHFLLLMSNQPLARYDSQNTISGHKIVYAILPMMCGEPVSVVGHKRGR